LVTFKGNRRFPFEPSLYLKPTVKKTVGSASLPPFEPSPLKETYGSASLPPFEPSLYLKPTVQLRFRLLNLPFI
jgi:hypothetical protein